MLRRAVAEALGTAFLLAAAGGSGIMGNRLAGGNIERSLPPWQTSLAHHRRAGSAQVFSEFIATAGLLSVIWDVRACARPLFLSPSELITGAYWFTASTSFANPVVTLARAASDTFAGIRPADVPWFVLAQFAGAMAATLLFRWLVPTRSHVS